MSKIDTSDFNNPSNYKNCALKSYEAYEAYGGRL